MLRREVLNLRELMQQMRPVDLTPEQLLDYIADTVDRFRRDTGIEASFVSDLQDVHVNPHVCRELVRIVQEGPGEHSQARQGDARGCGHDPARERRSAADHFRQRARASSSKG